MSLDSSLDRLRVQIPRSARPRELSRFQVDDSETFLLETNLADGQQQEMDIAIDDKNYKLVLLKEGRMGLKAVLFQIDLTGEGQISKELSLPGLQEDWAPQKLQQGDLQIVFLNNEGGTALRVASSSGMPFWVRSSSARLQDLAVDGLTETNVHAFLGGSSQIFVDSTGKQAAYTRAGAKRGAEKRENEDGVILLPDASTMIVADGMSSGGKGALAVREASKTMTYHAARGVAPDQLMHLGTQKLASVAKKYDLDLDQDGAAAVIVKDTGAKIEGAVVADAKIRIFDVTERKLVYSSGDQSIAGDVGTALSGIDPTNTIRHVITAANEGVPFGRGTVSKLTTVLALQIRGVRPDADLASEIESKVRDRLSQNSITSSINPRGDLDQAPLKVEFDKQAGHQYLVLAHTDGLILGESEIEQILMDAKGGLRVAVRQLKMRNEKETRAEREDTEEGYVDDASFGLMAA